MKYRVCILAILAVMTIATANADNWKNMNFRRNNSTTSWSRKGSVDGGHSNGWNYKGSSVWWNTNTWNYKGTELRGVTHGGGSNPYNRNYDRNENRGWDFSQANGRYDITRQSAGVKTSARGSYQFNTASPAAGKRVRIVTSKTFAEGSGRHYGGIGGGGSTERTYRYAPQQNHYGENMANPAKMVAVKQSSVTLSASGVEDATVEYDKSGQSRIGRGGTGGGPSSQPGAGDMVYGPMGDGLPILLLMAVAMTVWKMRK